MTPDETIEQQARREAEARYPYAIPGVMDDWERHRCINGYIAALIAERSKPQPSVDEVMEVVKSELWEAWCDVRETGPDDEGNDYENVDHDSLECELETRLRERLTKLFNVK